MLKDGTGISYRKIERLCRARQELFGCPAGRGSTGYDGGLYRQDLIPTTALDPSLLGYCTTALTGADGGRELSGCDECGGLQRECLHACKGLPDLRTPVLDDMDLEDKWAAVRSGYRELHPEITEGDTLCQHGDIDRMLLQRRPHRQGSGRCP